MPPNPIQKLQNEPNEFIRQLVETRRLHRTRGAARARKRIQIKWRNPSSTVHVRVVKVAVVAIRLITNERRPYSLTSRSNSSPNLPTTYPSVTPLADDPSVNMTLERTTNRTPPCHPTPHEKYKTNPTSLYAISLTPTDFAAPAGPRVHENEPKSSGE